MRLLFEDEIGAVEQALTGAQTRLRYYWCTHLARPSLSRSGVARWDGGHTRADTECDGIIRECVSSLPFAVNIVSEEGAFADSEPAACSFLVDPLDGTHNASAGYPMFSSCVAMHDGERYVFAWVYDMSRDITYVAARGKGAFLKTQLTCDRLSAPAGRNVDEAAIGLLRGRGGPRQRALTQLFWSAGKVRLSSCSSLDLCHIAAGVLDAFVDLSATGHERSCDIAAAGLILKEAGGALVRPDGSERIILAPSRSAVSDHEPLIACGSRITAVRIMDFLNNAEADGSYAA